MEYQAQYFESCDFDDHEIMGSKMFLLKSAIHEIFSHVLAKWFSYRIKINLLVYYLFHEFQLGTKKSCDRGKVFFRDSGGFVSLNTTSDFGWAAYPCALAPNWCPDGFYSYSVLQSLLIYICTSKNKALQVEAQTELRFYRKQLEQF
jgi:hypothetical protein